MALDASRTSGADHPSIPPDPPAHPAPTSTRMRPEQNPETIDGAAARIGALLRQRPELDPGRPEKRQRPEKKQPEEQPQDEFSVDDEAPEAPEAAQESDAGQDATPQDADSESAESNEGDAQQIELDAEQLAEVIGLDPTALHVTDDGALQIKTKIDGKEGTATLQDLIKGYQTDASLSRRGQQLAEREKTVSAKIEELESATHEGHQQLLALITAAKEALNPFSGVDWNRLKEDDPTQYGVLKADYRDWEGRMGGILQQATQHLTATQEKLDAERNAQMLQRKQTHLQKLEAHVPDWGPELQKSLEGYLESSYEMTPEDIAAVAQHWGVVDITRKARLYDMGVAKAKSKEVKKVPKLRKPGAKQSKTQQSQETLKSARMRLKKGGTVDDAAAFFRELGRRK